MRRCPGHDKVIYDDTLNVCRDRCWNYHRRDVGITHTISRLGEVVNLCVEVARDQGLWSNGVYNEMIRVRFPDRKAGTCKVRDHPLLILGDGWRRPQRENDGRLSSSRTHPKILQASKIRDV